VPDDLQEMLCERITDTTVPWDKALWRLVRFRTA
jgi:hypothetical protein